MVNGKQTMIILEKLRPKFLLSLCVKCRWITLLRLLLFLKIMGVLSFQERKVWNSKNRTKIKEKEKKKILKDKWLTAWEAKDNYQPNFYKKWPWDAKVQPIKIATKTRKSWWKKMKSKSKRIWKKQVQNIWEKITLWKFYQLIKLRKRKITMNLNSLNRKSKLVHWLKYSRLATYKKLDDFYPLCNIYTITPRIYIEEILTFLIISIRKSMKSKRCAFHTS